MKQLGKKNVFLEQKKDIDKRAKFLDSFAKELRKNKENLPKLLHGRWEKR